LLLESNFKTFGEVLTPVSLVTNLGWGTSVYTELILFSMMKNTKCKVSKSSIMQNKKLKIYTKKEDQD